MMQMLSPDLLDRRAIALIELVDFAGRPVDPSAQLQGEGLKFFSKGNGRFVLLEAPDFAEYSASFLTRPSAPAVSSKTASIDIISGDPSFLSRRAELKLPRNAEPTARTDPASLFQPVRLTLLPATNAPIPASAAALRVIVTHKTNRKLVGNALVRVRSANGKFSAAGMTDLSGEALLLIPYFPISFTTGAANVEDSLAATATVVADPAQIELTEPADLAVKKMARGGAPLLADPDKIGAAFPTPANGTALRLSARRVATLAMEWTPP
ncbi:MAG: hypothetical protein RL481_2329 [Pseudomonadota bacterium]|jgi:hypothetical protein